jgi:thioredoxin reductase (NADPH)
MTDEVVDAVVVGAGPCGLAAAISFQRAGLRAVVFDRSCVVASILEYPTYATFFSTAERLSLGGLPFIIATAKPSRRDALAYYRGVVAHFGLEVRQYHPVTAIERTSDGLVARWRAHDGAPGATRARAIVVATGYWGSPNLIGVPGEDLPHVHHGYKEGHHAFRQKVIVVGGGNSAAEAALDLWRCGANVTLVHFGPTFDKKIKPWILPDLSNRMAEGSIGARWHSRVTAIDPGGVTIHTTNGTGDRLPADHVYLLTGFAPDVALLQAAGVSIDAATGIPAHDPATLETNIPGLFIAGVVIAGFDANKVFIENGRYHGDKIVARILGKSAPETPEVSRDLDS